MAKRSKIKPPGKCIFCGGGAVPGNPMTGEHLWSEWMDDKRLLRRQSREYIQTGMYIRNYTGETSKMERHREGSPHYATIKAVCRVCNNGWMSTLETQVQGAITPLIKGEQTTLTKQARRTLTEWITLKMLVAEHSQYSGHEAAPIYSQADRDAFKLNRSIPDHLWIYIGAHKSSVWETGYHRRAGGLGFEAVPLPPPRLPTGSRNVHAITWGIGRLLVYISGSTDGEVERRVKFIKDPALRRLWPLLSTDIRWPPAQIVDGLFIDDIAGSLGRFLEASMSK